MKGLFHPSRITAARWSDVLISHKSVGVIAAGGEANGTCFFTITLRELKIYGIAFFALKVI